MTSINEYSKEGYFLALSYHIFVEFLFIINASITFIRQFYVLSTKYAHVLLTKNRKGSADISENSNSESLNCSYLFMKYYLMRVSSVKAATLYCLKRQKSTLFVRYFLSIIRLIGKKCSFVQLSILFVFMTHNCWCRWKYISNVFYCLNNSFVESLARKN